MMSAADRLLMALYGRLLALYPMYLRHRYRGQMMLTLREACGNRRQGTISFWLTIYFDLFGSIAREWLLMIRQQASTQPVFFHAVTMGVIFTLLGGAAMGVVQQMLRRGANEPQQQMAAIASSRLAQGDAPEQVASGRQVDLRRSLEPFLIYYNEQGRPQRAAMVT